MLAELAARVRNGDLSPVALVEESLRRIEQVNPTLNSVVALRADEALAEARRSTRRGRLAGLPILVKDLARCAGMRTTMGSHLLADSPPDTEDDLALARLRAEGAIVIGRTNTPPFGSSSITANALFGVTRNPWNPTRSPGGSSGGSAAALAAGLAPLATGSDGGGSVRIPASCCGLVGYKPTMGLIGRNHIPGWMGFAAVGTLGTSVADVIVEASIELGPAPGDIISVPTPADVLTPTLPQTILVTRSFRGYVDPGIEASFDDVCRTLASDGNRVEEVPSPFDTSTVLAWLTISAADFVESMAWCRERWSELEPAIRAHLDHGETLTRSEYIAAQRKRYADAAVLDQLLGESRVLLVPTFNIESFPAEGPFPSGVPGVTDDPLVGLNTPELNFTTHPAVNVPMGIDRAGVPYGLQVIAPRFADRLALGTAALIEQLRPWPVVAPGYTPFDSAF